MAQFRDTYRPARFFFLDARAGALIIGCLLHVRLWTVILTAVALVIFYLMERKGLSIPSAARAARVYFSGDLRPGRQFTKRRGMIDYERRQKP